MFRTSFSTSRAFAATASSSIPFCSRRWNSSSPPSSTPSGEGSSTTASSTSAAAESASAQASSASSSDQQAEQPQAPRKRRVRLHQKGVDEKRSNFRQGSGSFLAGFSSISLISLGCAFLFVPLYRLYCSPQGKGADPKFIASKARRDQEDEDAVHLAEHRKKLLKIKFLGDVGQGMPMKFVPLQREMEVLIGEPALAFFSALNLTDRTLTGTSVYSISPAEVMLYLNKIQCFCFEEQRIRPMELLELPVFFYISKDFQSDPLCYGQLDEAILSYTFYNLETTKEIVGNLMKP